MSWLTNDYLTRPTGDSVCSLPIQLEKIELRPRQKYFFAEEPEEELSVRQKNELLKLNSELAAIAATRAMIEKHKSARAHGAPGKAGSD